MDLYTMFYEAKEKNSRNAQRRILEKYEGKMFLLCRRYVKSDETARETMMNGFLRFFNTLERFDYTSEQSANSWIKTIMRNECLSQLQRKSYLDIDPAEESEDVPAEEDVISSLTAKEVHVYIAQLPEGYRTVFNLFEVEGYDHKEIAEILGIKWRTSSSQLAKAKKMLREIIIKNHKEYENRLPKK